MRILIATHTLGVVGGAETYVRALIPLLQQAGHQVAVLAYNPCPPKASPIVLDSGVPTWSMAGGADAGFVAAAAWKPDVAYNQGLSEITLDERFAATFPTLFFAHAYYGMCISGAKCYSRQNYQPCTRRMGLGCLGLYYPKGCGGRSPITLVRMIRQSRRSLSVLNRSKHLAVASRHMAAELSNHGLPPNRVSLLPLFPTDVIPESAPPPQRPRTDRVLLLGRLTPPKGMGVVVSAVATASKIQGRALTLVVAGHGSEHDTLQADAQHWGLVTEFLGWIGAEQRNSELRRADVLLFPSLWPEPFGLVGIEAGCLGVPAVGFGVGGSVDWLQPGISGEIATDRTAAGLGQALARLLEDDTTWQTRRIGAWSVAREFTAERHVAALESVLKAVIPDSQVEFPSKLPLSDCPIRSLIERGT